METRLSRLLFAASILAAAYLIPVNLALNLPATRAYLNGMQPDHFKVTWERAWSLYPLRVELTGLAADGQTATEQWQLDAVRAAASVSVLPLLKGQILVHDLDLADIDLRLRPRPSPEDGPGDFAEYFPVIRNRDPDAPAEAPPEEEDGTLVLELDDIQVKGEHDIWVNHIRGRLPGEVRGSFRADTHTGRLSLAGGALDLVLQSLQIADRAPVTDAASLKGRVEIPPFRLSETEGLEFLRVGNLDAQIDLPVRDLSFLALFMPVPGGMALCGQGRLRGRVVLSGGEALRGTDLVVEAHELAMDLGAYRFSGDGLVEILVDPEDEAQADLTVRFDRVQAELDPSGAAAADRPQVLFSGQGLTAQLHAAETDPSTTSTAVKAEELLSEVELKLLLNIPSMQVADLSVYNRLFPPEWGLEFSGGTGTLNGEIEATPERLSVSLDLGSDEAGLRYKDYQATTDLLLTLRARVDEAERATLHLDGTSLRVADTEVTVAGTKAAPAEPWTADLRIDQATLILPPPVEGDDADPMLSAAELWLDQGFGALLSAADGRLSAALSVSRLDWIPDLLHRPLDLTLTGSGEIDAEIVLARGLPVGGTDLVVKTDDLSMTLAKYRFSGDGMIELRTDPADARRGDLTVRFGEVQADLMAARDSAAPPLFSGRNLEASLRTEPRAAGASGGKDGPDEETDRRLSLSIPSMKVPDLGVYNRLLPEKWGVHLLGGRGEVGGRLAADDQSATLELDLSSNEADLRYQDEHITTDLALALRAKLLFDTGAALDLTGTELRLDQARLTKGSDREARPWQAALRIEEGRLEVPVEEAGADPAAYLTERFVDEGLGTLLADAGGRLGAKLTVSRLGWVPRLLDSPFGLTLSGAGEMSANLVLEDGWLAKGTTLDLPPQALEVGFLEHLVEGRGQATLTFASGGRRPDLRLDARLADARVRRAGDDRAELERMRLAAEILVADVTPDGAGETAMKLRIPSARILDMSVFNAYLPSNTPVKLLSGEASLIGGLQIKPETAGGELLLKAEGVRVGVRGEELSGDLRVDLLVRDGAPSDMRFDISGSRIDLEGFRVAGDTASYARPGWGAHLEIEKADLVWKKPLHLGMRALTTMKDSRPVVAVLDNVRGEQDWIDGLLEAEDLAGHIELVLDGERAVLSDAMLGSPRINVGAKGLADGKGLEGLVYVRWNDLTGALAFQGEERHFHLIGARRKFDAYVPGRTAMVPKESAEAEIPAGRSAEEPGEPAGQRERGRTAEPDRAPSGRRGNPPAESENPFLSEDL